MGKLEGRTALVTGASRGIGRAIAERFAAEGANVAINYANNKSAAEEVQAAVASHGGQAAVYQADVADQDACEAMCEAAMGDFGQIDILVNNAGIGSAAINRPHVADATNEQWQLLLGANLWGPIFMCRALVPHMRNAARSDVIVISSIAAQSLGAGFGVYSVSKSAVEAFAHTLAREERGNGMRVNIIAPGLVDTDMGRRIVSVMSGSDDFAASTQNAAFGFVCTPDDIAASAAHLCSEDGRYITNRRITIAGD